jgi:hypothetical protein
MKFVLALLVAIGFVSGAQVQAQDIVSADPQLRTPAFHLGMWINRKAVIADDKDVSVGDSYINIECGLTAMKASASNALSAIMVPGSTASMRDSAQVRS